MAAGDEGLRRRRGSASIEQTPKRTTHNECDGDRKHESSHAISTGTYWLTRIVLIRYLGFIYFVAFLVAFHQNKQLIGKDGLLPGRKFLNSVKQQTGGINRDAWSYVPTLLWLVDYNTDINSYLDYLSLSGLGLAGFIIVLGGANIPVMAALWMLYHSIVNVGQRWYSFGWESQLLESGFLCAFLCPLWSLSPVPRGTPTPRVVIWGNRWLIFRIMLGAGLIKIRGDKCWRELTCMNYHYETQPVPNPISYYMHQSPEVFHKFETLVNHFVELLAPFLLVLPRKLMMAGGGIQILFQVVLIISGNLSFLNWLTILPSLACFDDASLSWMFSDRRGSVRWRVAQIHREEREGKSPRITIGTYIRRVYNVGLGCLLVYLSIPVVQNLLSSRQAMNTSFDSLRLVNTYGAFGSITKRRTEVVFQGTYDIDPGSPNAQWEEYEFKCKPGNVTRRPCLISPYHYRLDWLMWFAAFQSYQHNPWLVHLAVKLLSNDEGATSLIEYNPFQGKTPPLYIRAEHYRYRYTKIGSKDAKNGKWWNRKYIGNYLPPISLNSVKDFMKQMGWTMPRLPAR